MTFCPVATLSVPMCRMAPGNCLSVRGQLKDIKTLYTDISSVRAFGGQVAFIGFGARRIIDCPL